MVAVRREDGLYDIDGVPFPVPRQYVPAEHLPPEESVHMGGPALRIAPDLRLAQAYEDMTPEQKYIADKDAEAFRDADARKSNASSYDDPRTWAQPVAPVTQPSEPYQGGGGSSGINAPPPNVAYTAEGNRPPEPEQPESRPSPTEGSGHQGSRGKPEIDISIGEAQIAGRKDPSELATKPQGQPSQSQQREPSDIEKADQARLLGQIRRNAQGSYTPGGDVLASQTWQQQDVAPPPGMIQAIDESGNPKFVMDPRSATPQYAGLQRDPNRYWADSPEAQEQAPDWLYQAENRTKLPPPPREGEYEESAEYTQPDRPLVVKDKKGHSQLVPVMQPESVPFKAAENIQNEAQGDLEQQRQAEALREGGRERALGQSGMEGVLDIRKRLDQYEQQHAADNAERQKLSARIEETLNDIPNLARRTHVPAETRSHFVLSIAQALLVAGGRPFVDLVQQDINTDLAREQMELQWAQLGMHGGAMKLNALGMLMHQLGSKEAAVPAFIAMRRQNIQDELVSMAQKYNGGRMSDQAQQMWNEQEVQKANDLKMAHAAAHEKLYKTVGPTATAGKDPWTTIREWVQKRYAGTSKQQQEAAVADALERYNRGELPQGFTAAPEQTSPRVVEMGHEYDTKGRIVLDPRITGQSGVAYWPGGHEGAVVQAARTQSAAVSAIEMVDEIESLAKKVGHWTPGSTTQAQILSKQAALVAKINVLAQEGSLSEEKNELLHERIAANRFKNLTNYADLQTLASSIRQDIVTTARGLIPVEQFVRTPPKPTPRTEGAKPVIDVSRETHKVPD